jgi:lysophospholipase L1-like esterase
MIFVRFALFFAFGWSASAFANTKPYPSPDKFAKNIAKFVAADGKEMPAPGGIVCIGSSSMRMWKTIKKDLAPLPIVHRGFGGSNMNDVVHYMDKIVLPYKPRAILLYEGDNDANQGVSTAVFLAKFGEFVGRVRAELPNCRIYVLSAKPSIKRLALWPRMTESNNAIKDICAADPRLTYLDVATPMLLADGNPNPKLFIKDNLHMNEKGYAIWTKVVRTVLLENESIPKQ